MHPPPRIEEPFMGMGNTAGGLGRIPFAGPGPLAAAADTAPMNVLMSCLTQLSANINELASTVARNNLRLNDVTTQITAVAGNAGSSAGAASAFHAGPTTSDVPVHEGPQRGTNTGPFAVRGRHIRPARGQHRVPTGDDLVIAKTTTNKLSAMQRCARTEILKRTRQSIRALTGVLRARDSWPAYTEGGAPRLNPETGVAYFNIHLGAEEGVDHPVNVKLLARVAEDVENGLKSKAHLLSWMDAPDVNISQALVFELAKITWPSHAMRAAADGLCVAISLARAVDLYKERHGGIDPTPLLDVSMMSDEVSGPEEDSGETKDEWKARMASCLGMGKLDPDVFKALQIFEVIRPNWRLDEYAAVLQELWEIYASTLTAKQAQCMIFRVRTSGHTSDDPPAAAPYNVGFKSEWYEEFKEKETHCVYLGDWGNYEDPPGFGASVDVPDEPQGPNDAELEDENGE
ncbi:hypothetical protein BN946_scf184642.g1 [Trametes cinnabarina]|uniref:Uncharacterized protein n=1 Tax=Pycnoporus cinnabarinus TaxID=5643 RepID=A0A060SJA5_PYCCI|nr:hypothetical protein BN946_scf184642.g1 [Trametes cinnabarina]